jgi:MarR family transcriptional regulator for hemolysin
MRTKIDTDSFGFLFNDIARITRSVFAREIEAGQLTVTAAEARVLAHMARCGPTRQHLLAESLGMTPMSLTGFLDRLEADGLIAREADPKDRRAKIVTLTPKANGTLSQIAQAGERTEQAISKGLCPDDWAAFVETARKLRANIDGPRVAAANTEDAL